MRRRCIRFESDTLRKFPRRRGYLIGVSGGRDSVALLHRLIDLGYRKLIGRVLGDSQDTLRLCQATGWREVGRHEQHARHGDRLRDVVLVEFHVPPVPTAE